MRFGSLGRRLEYLEASTRQGDKRDATTRKVLELLTTEELRAYVGVLRRMRDCEESLEEDGQILARVEELYEEVGEK